MVMDINLTREPDASKLNAVINDPSIYPWVKGFLDGPIDLTAAVADESNICLMAEHGGVIFHRHQMGLFEVHTQILPAGRGPWAVAMAQEAAKYMFCRTDAMEIMTKVPKGNFAARALTKAIGGSFEFTNKRGWVKDGQIIPADIFRLTIQDWIRTAPNLVERGHLFHERLEAEFTRLGVSEASHDDDDTHDRYVGAACEMILGGQPQKGIIFYNRWAALADYKQVGIVSLNPLLIDIRNAVVAVGDDGQFNVVSLP